MKYMNFFDEVYYINLDERTDRREHFENQIKELEIVATRFSGIRVNEEHMPYKWKTYYEEAHDKDTYGWTQSKLKALAEIGCAYSHVAVIKEAQAKGLKNVLIFEDDCVFLDSWKNNIQTVVDELKSFNDNWDIVYFGGEIPSPLQITKNDSIKKLIPSSGGIYCLHAYAINERYFHKILGYDPEFCRQIDVMLVNSPGKNYFPLDIMVVQKSNIFSNITNRLTSEQNETEQIKRWNKNIIVGET